VSAGGHERERLSAYLDGELPAAEAAAVAAHVAGCAECAGRLAEMAAVDERFAGAPVETPEGYFDAYASRVRARIEAEPRRGPRRVPAWTWAVAAVLVLAVVTPLTLRGRVVAPPSAPPAPAPIERTTGLPAPATPAHAEAVAGRDAGTPAPQLAKTASDREGKESAAGGAARRQESPATREEAGAPEPARRGAADEAANAAVAPSGAEEATVVPLQEAPRPAAAPASAPLSADAAVGYGAIASAESRAKATSASAPADRPGRETATASFARLTAAVPRTAAGWRQARESWRAFASAHPADPLADEARVRAVEAAFEAWRADRDAADRRVLESDARSYLARGDAAQRERVIALVRRAESPDR